MPWLAAMSGWRIVVANILYLRMAIGVALSGYGGNITALVAGVSILFVSVQ